ncbi:hypothetical protein HOD08_02135 [bacterium]|jgi:hypothetical protein|nr:hypothetical protein [bacterium]
MPKNVGNVPEPRAPDEKHSVKEKLLSRKFFAAFLVVGSAIAVAMLTMSIPNFLRFWESEKTYTEVPKWIDADDGCPTFDLAPLVIAMEKYSMISPHSPRPNTVVDGEMEAIAEDLEQQHMLLKDHMELLRQFYDFDVPIRKLRTFDHYLKSTHTAILDLEYKIRTYNRFKTTPPPPRTVQPKPWLKSLWEYIKKIIMPI